MFVADHVAELHEQTGHGVAGVAIDVIPLRDARGKLDFQLYRQGFAGSLKFVVQHILHGLRGVLDLAHRCQRVLARVYGINKTLACTHIFAPLRSCR